MSAAHALLAPSSAARWVVCAGSVLLAALYPEEATQDTREGEASHWAGFEILSGRIVCVGLVAPNGITLTEEMIEGAEMYVEEIDRKLAMYGLTRADLHIEERVAIPEVHDQNWGTPDCWFYVWSLGLLFVFDYKYGHRFIEVFENWQLVDYTAGILTAIGVDGHTDQLIAVEMTIVQPRSYRPEGPVRTWSVKASALRARFNLLKMAAEKALALDATCITNDECDFCPGRHACKARQEASFRAIEIAGGTTPVELTGKALGVELSMLEHAKRSIEARMTGLEEQAAIRIRQGEQVPGYILEQSFGRETWKRPIAEVVALGNLFNITLAKEAAVTPLEAVKRGIPKEVIAEYKDAPHRGMKLVRDDGTRARKIFGN